MTDCEPIEGEREAGLPGRGNAGAENQLDDAERGGEADGGGGIAARDRVGKGEGEEVRVCGEWDGAWSDGVEGRKQIGDGGRGDSRGQVNEKVEGIRVRVRVTRVVEEVWNAEVIAGFDGGPDGELKRGFDGIDGSRKAAALTTAKKTKCVCVGHRPDHAFSLHSIL